MMWMIFYSRFKNLKMIEILLKNQLISTNKDVKESKEVFLGFFHFRSLYKWPILRPVGLLGFLKDSEFTEFGHDSNIVYSSPVKYLQVPLTTAYSLQIMAWIIWNSFSSILRYIEGFFPIGSVCARSSNPHNPRKIKFHISFSIQTKQIVYRQQQNHLNKERSIQNILLFNSWNKVCKLY
jgi:hypothetical protein